MRILVLESHPSPIAGGAERTMRAFLEAIGGDHEIHLAYMQPGEHVTDPIQSVLYASTIKIDLQPLSLRTGAAAARDLVRLSRFVQRHRIERVITHMVHVSPFLRGVKELTGVPFSIYFKWVLSSSTAGVKVVWGNAAVDRAAAVSGSVRDYWICNGVPSERIAVVPEGIDVSMPRPRRLFANATIGFAGRLVPEKGLIDLIDAMPTILACHPDTSLRIAGSYRADASGAAYRAQVEERIQALGITASIVFDGFVSPLEDWLNERDVVVVPSTCNDAQPIVLMQAMAVGTSVVASRVGGIPEVLAGEFANLMVPPSNPAALAERVCAYLADADHRARIGASLRQRCINLYSHPVHVSSLIKALGVSAPSSLPLVV